MTRQPVWLLLVLATLLLEVVFAQSGTPAVQGKSDPIKITGLANAALRFTMAGKARSLAFEDDLAGCWSEVHDGADPKSAPIPVVLAPRVIDEVRKGNAWYVTLQVTLGSSCNVNGMCGAGTTVNLLWLKLNQQLVVQKKQASLVMDCISDITLTKWVGRTGNDIKDATDPKLEMRGGVLQLEFERDDYINKKKTVSKLRYDHRNPEKGLVISSQTSALK